MGPGEGGMKRADFVVKKPDACGRCGNTFLEVECLPFSRRVEAYKCILCGHRVWADFNVRNPSRTEQVSVTQGMVKGYRGRY